MAIAVVASIDAAFDCVQERDLRERACRTEMVKPPHQR